MSDDGKTRLLIFGDSAVVLKALEQYIAIVPGLEHCEVLGRVEYGSGGLLTQGMLMSADFMLYGLYRRYGARLRAEGVASLGKRIERGRKALVYGFDIAADLAANPLVWDVFGTESLANKLAAWPTTLDARTQALRELEDRFGKEIFPVDGHT